MSSSTVALEGGDVNDDAGFSTGPSPKFLEPRSPVLLIASLWIFQSIFSACKLSFISNYQGLAVVFNMQDVVLIAFAAWMLDKGLSTRNVALVFPWTIVSLYGLYFNHYKDLNRMTTTLKTIRHVSGLSWVALLVISVGLGLQVILTLRILQLSANLWYRKKLEKELYETLN